MDPEIWGPVFWDLLFDIAHHYYQRPEVEHITKFFNDTQYFLPCGGCRDHYRSYLDQCFDRELSSSCEDMGLHFLFPLKNSVNRRLEKREISCQLYLERRRLFPVRGSVAAVRQLLDLIGEKVTHELAETWCADALRLYAGIFDCREPVSSA